ncbi:MAG: protein translocase SEC61 complex subunit gamma [Candidatus Micrarchaeia archaeon]|jgi:protein transport protein SEC61 subunit gamma-like protein
MDVKAEIMDFVRQSERVINVTHMPKQSEFELIAKSTALGVAIIGVIGFLVAAVSRLLGA